MKLIKTFWLCVLCSTFTGSAVTCSAFGSTPDLPTLVDEADVICVAKIVDVKSLDRVKIEVVHKDSDGNPVTIDAQNAIADVVVESVLKGEIKTSPFQVTFFKNIPIGFNSSPFTELVGGENEMLFLTATNDKSVFALTELSSHGRSKICFGTASAPSPPSGLTPMRAVLFTITGVLSRIGISQSNILDCLQRLRTVAYLLYVKPGVYPSQLAIKKRLALDEPLFTDQSSASSLEQYVKVQILPPIIDLTKTPVRGVSEQAFVTAGSLQDANVIPDLARIAAKNYAPGILGLPADTISGYRNPDATVPLIRILTSSSADVRQKASYALGKLHNRLALPFLLERLDDSDPHVITAASESLFEVTDQFGSQLPPGDAQSLQIREITFWKKWSMANQDELIKLRSQFGAAATANAAP